MRRTLSLFKRDGGAHGGTGAVPDTAAGPLRRSPGADLEAGAASRAGLRRLYLIRHGETEWSLAGRHTGRTDISLTARGEADARRLAPWLADIPFARVLTSPRRRAMQTCALAGLGTLAETAPDLSEWDYGDYDGRRSEDIRKLRPDWNLFRDGCPQGETAAQASDRADKLFAALRTTPGNVALFSHGQFGAVLAARWIGLPVLDAQHFALGPASLSVLAHDSNHPEVRTIALWNAAPLAADRPF